MILTPFSDLSPVPRVNIRLDDLDPSAAFVSVFAVVGDATRIVRGGYQLPIASLVILDDFLAPFNTPILYRAELLDEAGGTVGVVEATSPPVMFYGTVLQQLIDPWRSASARLLATSESDLVWQHDGGLERPSGAARPTWVGAGRWPLQGIPVKLGTDTAEQEAAMRRVLGLDHDRDHLPVYALRTSHRVRFPQPLVAVIPEPRAQGLDWLAGGYLTHWHLKASEVQPPAASLVRSAVTWDDVAATFLTWSEVIADYSTWGELMADYGLSGSSNA